MPEPLTRQEMLDQREAYSYSSDHVVMADTALHYEARLREVEEVLRNAAEWFESWPDADNPVSDVQMGRLCRAALNPYPKETL